MRSLILSLSLSLLYLLPVTAQDLSGSWEGNLNHEGSVWHLGFDLQQADTLVTGTLYRDGEEYGPLRGSIHANRFLMTWSGLPFEGTQDGDRLDVQLTVYNGTKYRFTMQRRSR